MVQQWEPRYHKLVNLRACFISLIHWLIFMANAEPVQVLAELTGIVLMIQPCILIVHFQLLPKITHSFEFKTQWKGGARNIHPKRAKTYYEILIENLPFGYSSTDGHFNHWILTNSIIVVMLTKWRTSFRFPLTTIHIFDMWQVEQN